MKHFTHLLSRLLSIFALLFVVTGMAWAETSDEYDFYSNGVTRVSGPSSGNTPTSTETFVVKAKTGNTTDNWTISFPQQTYFNYGKNNGLIIGSNNYAPHAVATSKSYSNVTKVEVITTASSITASLSVFVDDIDFGNETVTNPSKKTSTFTHSAASGNVKISVDSNTEKQFKIEKIIITYGEDEQQGPVKQDATFNFSAESYNINELGSWTLPDPATTEGLTVTYSVAPTDKMELESGKTFKVKAYGSATITASWDEQTIGETTYNAGSKDVSVTIVNPNATYYRQIKSVDDIVSGATYAIGCASKNSVMSGISSNNGTETSVTITDGAFLNTEDLASCGIIIEKVGSGTDAYYTMKMGDIYLGHSASNSTNFVTDNSATSNGYKINISFNTSDNVKIVTKADNSRELAYGTGFRWYKDGSTAIQLYKLDGSDPVVNSDLFKFEFENDSYTFKLGSTFTSPKVIALYDAETEVTSGITYTSSDEGVARVGNDGNLTLVSVGTTTITAKFESEGYNTIEASYELTVTELDVFTASFSKTEFDFDLGTQEDFYAPTLTTNLPEDVETLVVYESSAEAVATVDDETGEVSIIGKGDVTITATIMATGYEDAIATYTISVTNSLKGVPSYAIFNFESEEFLKALNISIPAKSGETVLEEKEYTFNGVTMKVGARTSNNSTKTRIYNSSGGALTLRTYNNSGVVTFEVPEGFIITAASTDVNNGGTLEDNVFTLAPGKTIKNVTITYTDPSDPRRLQNLTVGTNGISSFCTKNALDFTGIEDVKAYIATSVDGTSVNLQQVTGKVPGNTGLLLIGDEEGANADVPVVESVDELSVTNLLKPAFNGSSIPCSDGTTFRYVFGTKNGEKGFYKLVNNPMTSTGNFAYLESDTDYLADSGVRGLTLNFGSTETAIQTVETEAANTGIYTISGAKIDKAGKGLYIINGKKVIK